MIKIEKLNGGCKPTYMRNNKRQVLMLHQLISMSEFHTIEFDVGSITYSVDELEVGELLPKVKPVAKPVVEPVVEPVAEPQPEPAPQPAPFIKPSLRKAAKKATNG